MSSEAREWVWEHSSSRGAARLVLLSIADRVADEQCISWASLSSLAKRTRASVSTVREAVERLLLAGELEQLDDLVGPQRSTVYRLSPPKWSPWPSASSRSRKTATQQQTSPRAPRSFGSRLCGGTESARVRYRNPPRGSGIRQYRKPAGRGGNRHSDVPATGTAMYRLPAHRTVVNLI